MKGRIGEMISVESKTAEGAKNQAVRKTLGRKEGRSKKREEGEQVRRKRGEEVVVGGRRRRRKEVRSCSQGRKCRRKREEGVNVWG